MKKFDFYYQFIKKYDIILYIKNNRLKLQVLQCFIVTNHNNYYKITLIGK